MKLTKYGAAGASAVLALTVGLTGCSGDRAASPGSDDASARSEGSIGKRDDVVTALTQATEASAGTWDGDVMVLEFEEGSAQDTMARVKCRAANTLIAEDERAVLSYPDGRVDCEQARHE